MGTKYTNLQLLFYMEGNIMDMMDDKYLQMFSLDTALVQYEASLYPCLFLDTLFQVD